MIAYLKGQHARHKRAPITANPYSRNCDPQKFRAWRRGWKDALP